MKHSSKKILLLILILIIAILIGMRQISPKLSRYLNRQRIEKENTETMQRIKEENVIKTKIINDTLIPEKAYLEVPFICQAPLETEANWKYHEESCEEAALLQAYLYETGKTMTKMQAHEEILKMIDWQKNNFGSHHDIYADELKKFIIGYYELSPSQIKIIYNAAIEDIKKQIAFGYPVIVPITAGILKNPYYPHPGYHMLTVIGYTKDRIITNDNGTRRGKDFSYDYEIFKKAMDDVGGNIIWLEL